MSLCRLTWGAWRRTLQQWESVLGAPTGVLRAALTPPALEHVPCKEPQMVSPRAEPSGLQLPQAPQHPHLWNKPASLHHKELRANPAFLSVNDAHQQSLCAQYRASCGQRALP